MRRYRHRDGSLRVWFGPEEIDQMAEEALHRAGLLPRLEAPVVDVERFLEGYLGADLDQYAPLPHDVLGATEFRPGVPPLVQVNAALTRAALDDPHPPPGSRGRWRATLAHEAGHVLLHRALVEPDPSQTSLFDPPDRLFRCLQREVAFGEAATGGKYRRTGSWPRCSCRSRCSLPRWSGPSSRRASC
ncbi:MAG: hypothetical protein QN148_05570 [Armatimonadota bacterium]|nr:hypothetical protein [Armatimonadota bacterium]MDR7595450.1 hypothetical protein [Armatimonadota bacterium]